MAPDLVTFGAGLGAGGADSGGFLCLVLLRVSVTGVSGLGVSVLGGSGSVGAGSGGAASFAVVVLGSDFVGTVLVDSTFGVSSSGTSVLGGVAGLLVMAGLRDDLLDGLAGEEGVVVVVVVVIVELAGY